jgi:two-component system LytT family sensor kinase
MRLPCKFGGIGIRNVQKRLSLLYPEKQKLLIAENQNSYKVELKINTNV